MIRNSLQKYEIKKQLLSHDKAIPLHEQKHSILEPKWATLFKNFILHETLTQQLSTSREWIYSITPYL